MKRYYPSLFLVFASVVTAWSQKVDFQRLDFGYNRLPLKPFPKGVTTYKVNVDIPYAQTVQLDKQQYDRQLEDIKKANMRRSSNVSTGQLGTAGSLANMLPEEPYFAKIYDAPYVSSAIRIDGYNQSDNSEVKVNVTLQGFEVTESTLKSRENRVTNNNVVTVVKKFYYEVRYRHIMDVNVSVATGSLYQAKVRGTESILSQRTQEYATEMEAIAFWRTYKTTFIRDLDEKLMVQHLQRLQEDLNYNFGISVVRRNTKIFVPVAKKMNYDDYKMAYINAMGGYNQLQDKNSEAAARDQIRKALDAWNNALKESKPKDPRARINDRVTAATYLNCAEAYIWLGEFGSAEAQLGLARLMDINRYNDEIADLTNLMREQKQRKEANP